MERIGENDVCSEGLIRSNYINMLILFGIQRGVVMINIISELLFETWTFSLFTIKKNRFVSR